MYIMCCSLFTKKKNITTTKQHEFCVLLDKFLLAADRSCLEIRGPFLLPLLNLFHASRECKYDGTFSDFDFYFISVLFRSVFGYEGPSNILKVVESGGMCFEIIFPSCIREYTAYYILKLS